MQVRVRHLQPGFVHGHFVSLIIGYRHDVDIDQAVDIASCGIAVTGTAQPALYVVNPLQYRLWTFAGADGYSHVEEAVLRLKAPGFTFNHAGNPASARACRQGRYGLAQVGFTVAQVGPYVEIIVHLGVKSKSWWWAVFLFVIKRGAP